MSKREIIKSLRQEIRHINYRIDQKIIQGLPYYQESRRHKFLMYQLNRHRSHKEGWFSKSFGFALF